MGALKHLLYRLWGYPSFLRRLQAPYLLRMLELHPSHVILDMGCGDSQLTYEVARRAGLAIGMDLGILAEDVAWLQGSTPALAFSAADASRLPLADGSIDRILLSSLLEMVPQDAAVLRECFRVLKPGGLLVLSVPCDYPDILALYQSSHLLFRLGRKLLRLPMTYAEFKDRLNQRFGVAGKGYYQIGQLRDALLQAAFQLEVWGYAPGAIGCLVWEVSLLYWFAFQSTLAARLIFLLHPLVGAMESMLPLKPRGCELLAKAIRMEDSSRPNFVPAEQRRAASA